MTTVVEHGARLRGERVRIVARGIDMPRLSQKDRSGTHKRMVTVAHGSVECTLEQAARWVYDQKK